MRIPETRPPQPTACHLLVLPESKAAVFMAFTGLFLARLPIIISAIIIGNPTANMQRRYINTNAPPPSVPAL